MCDGIEHTTIDFINKKNKKREKTMFNFPKNFYSDVRIERNYNSVVEIKMGQLGEIDETNDVGAIIRLFDEKKWYYTSTTDLKNLFMIFLAKILLV